MRHVGRKQDLTASRALLALIDASYYDDPDDDDYCFIMIMLVMMIMVMFEDIQFLFYDNYSDDYHNRIIEKICPIS